jgi:uncharacterized membrane protein
MVEEDEKSGGEHRLDRTLAISDGVFAFAVTLLVLDLTVPSITGATSVDLLNALSEDYITFFAYALSFLIAGIWWNAHHRNFELIRRSNATLRWLNLFFLLWIALLPFFTKIISHFQYVPLGVILYAVDQAAAGIFLTLIWVYASRNHQLIDKNMKEKTIRYVTIRNMIAPIFFLASMGIAFINPFIATVFWVGMFPFLFVFHRLERKK